MRRYADTHSAPKGLIVRRKERIHEGPLLDLDQPWKVIASANQALLCPEADYELTGFVPGVCFPVGCLCDATTGRPNSKYLNFGEERSGLIITNSGGPVRVDTMAIPTAP